MLRRSKEMLSTPASVYVRQDRWRREVAPWQDVAETARPRHAVWAFSL